MKLHKLLENYYNDDSLMAHSTKSPASSPSPAIAFLLNNRYLLETYNTTILDYSSGKYPRNADYLRENGYKVYAYDAINGKDVNGWSGVTNKLPNRHFDVALTTYVLNTVPRMVEEEILDNCESLASQTFHITRNKDIVETVWRAMKSGNKTVMNFYNNYAKENGLNEAHSPDNITENMITDFCNYGVKTPRGFIRSSNLESDGYQILKTSNKYKIYTK